MSSSIHALSDFLLHIYRDAHALSPDTFQQSILERLRNLVGFDFAAWGGGGATDRDVYEVKVLDQDPRVLTEWPEVGPEDAFCDLTLDRLNQTWMFDDIQSYRDGVAFNEHWKHYEVSHMMSTIMSEPQGDYVSFLGLFHEDMAHPFSERDRLLVQQLMPHLGEALRMNRDWTVSQAAIGAKGAAMINPAGWILSQQGNFAPLIREEWGVNFDDRVPLALVQAAHEGERWRGHRIQARFKRFGRAFLVRLCPASPLSGLPPRAREVAILFGRGLSYKEVAREMKISPETVRKHLSRAYEILGVRSKAELARATSTSHDF